MSAASMLGANRLRFVERHVDNSNSFNIIGSSQALAVPLESIAAFSCSILLFKRFFLSCQDAEHRKKDELNELHSICRVGGVPKGTRTQF